MGKKYYGMVWGNQHKMFNTLRQARKYKTGLYNRGLLFGRHVQIIEYMDGTDYSKVVFDKDYDASYSVGHGSGPRRNPGIIGVALTQAGKFLGFVDGKGKIRKGRVRKVRVNPIDSIWYRLGTQARASGRYRDADEAWVDYMYTKHLTPVPGQGKRGASAHIGKMQRNAFKRGFRAR